MRRVLLALLGLILLVGLSFFCFQSKASSIKENLISQANTALNSHNISWAKVDLLGNGTKLTNIAKLTGFAPSSEAKAQAAKIVSSIEGIGGVENDLQINVAKEDKAESEPKEVPESLAKNLTALDENSGSKSTEKEEQKTKKESSYNIYMVKNGEGKLFLEGYLPSKEAHEKLLSKAKELFDENKIEDSIKIEDNAPKDWEDMTLFGLEKLSEVDYGDMNITDYSYLFKAHLPNSQKKVEFLNSIKDVMSKPDNHYGRYRGDYIVTAPVADIKPTQKVAKSDDTKKRQEINSTKPKETKVQEAKRQQLECQAMLNKQIASRHINFAFNSSKISQNSYAILDDIAKTLQRCDLNGKILEIAGHTDSRGSQRYNLQLSQKRSENIKNYLVRQGVDANKLKAVGYGESMPIADNKTAAGRALNRRTEFNIKSK